VLQVLHHRVLAETSCGNEAPAGRCCTEMRREPLSSPTFSHPGSQGGLFLVECYGNVVGKTAWSVLSMNDAPPPSC
jgi:hypothetical protein